MTKKVESVMRFNVLSIFYLILFSISFIFTFVCVENLTLFSRNVRKLLGSVEHLLLSQLFCYIFVRYLNQIIQYMIEIYIKDVMFLFINWNENEKYDEMIVCFVILFSFFTLIKDVINYIFSYTICIFLLYMEVCFKYIFLKKVISFQSSKKWFF